MLNNPLRYTDPSGNDPEDPEDGGGGWGNGEPPADPEPELMYTAPGSDLSDIALEQGGVEPSGVIAPTTADIGVPVGQEIGKRGDPEISTQCGPVPPEFGLPGSSRSALVFMPYAPEPAKWSSIIETSGDVAETVNEFFNIPNVDNEILYAASGAMIVARVGVRFVPVVGTGVLAVQLGAWAWSGIAPRLANQLRAWGL